MYFTENRRERGKGGRDRKITERGGERERQRQREWGIAKTKLGKSWRTELVSAIPILAMLKQNETREGLADSHKNGKIHDVPLTFANRAVRRRHSAQRGQLRLSLCHVRATSVNWCTQNVFSSENMGVHLFVSWVCLFDWMIDWLDQRCPKNTAFKFTFWRTKKAKSA